MDKGSWGEAAHRMVLARCSAQCVAHCLCRFAEAYREKDAEEKKRIQDLKAEIKRHDQEVQDFSYGLYVSCRGRAGRPASALPLPRSHLAASSMQVDTLCTGELRPATLLPSPGVFHPQEQCLCCLCLAQSG